MQPTPLKVKEERMQRLEICFQRRMNISLSSAQFQFNSPPPPTPAVKVKDSHFHQFLFLFCQCQCQFPERKEKCLGNIKAQSQFQLCYSLSNLPLGLVVLGASAGGGCGGGAPALSQLNLSHKSDSPVEWM